MKRGKRGRTGLRQGDASTECPRRAQRWASAWQRAARSCRTASPLATLVATAVCWHANIDRWIRAPLRLSSPAVTANPARSSCAARRSGHRKRVRQGRRASRALDERTTRLVRFRLRLAGRHPALGSTRRPSVKQRSRIRPAPAIQPGTISLRNKDEATRDRPLADPLERLVCLHQRERLDVPAELAAPGELERGFRPASVLLRAGRFAEVGTNSGTKFWRQGWRE
jgi:hypothetical protein